jgi:hypothetical protein
MVGRPESGMASLGGGTWHKRAAQQPHDTPAGSVVKRNFSNSPRLSFHLTFQRYRGRRVVFAWKPVVFLAPPRGTVAPCRHVHRAARSLREKPAARLFGPSACAAPVAAAPRDSSRTLPASTPAGCATRSSPSSAAAPSGSRPPPAWRTRTCGTGGSSRPTAPNSRPKLLSAPARPPNAAPSPLSAPPSQWVTGHRRPSPDRLRNVIRRHGTTRATR